MESEVARQFVEGFEVAFREADPEVAGKAREAGNVRALRAQFEAVGRGDFAAVRDSVTEDFEFVIVGPPTVPFVGSGKGRDRLAEVLARNFGMVENQVPKLHSVVAQGDTVVVMGRERGNWRATGEAYDLHWIHVFTFRDGKVRRLEEYIAGAGPERPPAG